MKKKAQTQDNKKAHTTKEDIEMRERKERKNEKTEKKTKERQLLKKFFREKTEEEEKKKNQMPLANKEVVHLKTGWEKIQVRVLLFTTLFFIPRSFVRFSLSLLSSFFFLLCVCMFTKKMQQQQQQK